jgi:SagB-type dehydrogenase family enzyme
LESFLFEGYPSIALPTELTPLHLSLEEAITMRHSTRNMIPAPFPLKDLATLFHYAYGVTRLNIGTNYPRPFRTVPSGGALYPLELFFYSSHIEDQPAGLYHYNPAKNVIRRIREENLSDSIANLLVQPEIAEQASLIIFITAMFERSTFKYGDRGYRFVLLEAGHVAQNFNLVASGLGLGCLNIGGYFDKRTNELLELDGLTQSAIYLLAVGKEGDQSTFPAVES